MATGGFDHLPYRPCVGIVLINGDGLVWIGRRIPKWDRDHSAAMWQMPQGGIDPGETPRQAALRELVEETGVSRSRILAETPDWLSYDLPEEVLGVALKGAYRGQRQKWFAMRFEGDDRDIDIAHPAGGKPEFDAWKWVPASTVADLVVPFKREVYRQVIDAFADHLA